MTRSPPAGESTYTWTTTSTDPRALQVPGSTNRVAAVWYSATSFTVDVNLADGQTHDLELYFLDWDSKGRSEQVQLSDAGTGKVLATETISSFTNGVYLDWKVSGNLVITITRQAGANAVLNGRVSGRRAGGRHRIPGRDSVQRQHRIPAGPVDRRGTHRPRTRRIRDRFGRQARWMRCSAPCPMTAMRRRRARGSMTSRWSKSRETGKGPRSRRV